VSATIRRFAWPFAVLLAWMLAWRHLAADWNADEQYHYGFGVPVLTIWMAWRRFPGLMKPAPPKLICYLVIAGALAMLTLGEMLRRHDPLWRFTGVAITAGAALLSIGWLQRLGGGPLVRRQLFPLLFAATAVPWPVPVEIWTIRHLAAVVTDVAVTAANFFGVAALQHGNTIELANGMVGVDDACSGIQSLQATLMASLFLGEFFSLRTPRRITLAIAGAAVSFLMNCGRVLALTVLAHNLGPDDALKWHDAVGGTATACAFGLLLAATLLLARGNEPSPLPPSQNVTARMPGGIAIFATVLAIPLATHVWFLRFENAGASAGGPSAWVLSDSHLPAGWTASFVPPTKTVRTGLRFSEWQSYQLRDPDGATAQVTRLAWNSGARTPAFVTTHTPAVCLPSAGWTPSAPPFSLTIKVHDTELPCAAYPFGRDGVRLLALQNLTANGHTELRLVDPTQIPGTFRRFATLWQAPLRQITGELLLYIPDPGDPEARKKSAGEFLEAILVQDREK